jgi:hypothetical protein
MNHSRLLKAMLGNNNGVALVKHRNYEGAIIEFTNAMELLRPLLAGSFSSDDGVPVRPHELVEQNEELEVDSVSNAQETNTATLRPTASPGPQCLRMGEPYHYSAGCQRQSPDQPYVFMDPIEIPAEVAKVTPTQRLFSKLSMVAMYNLALAFHLSALELASVTRLVRAQKLYEFAFHMHLEESCDVTLLYSLALMNNLGLVYRLLSDERRSSQCFQHLLATMMFLLESEEAQKIQQWDGLMSNVLGLIFTEHAVAAAA